ncbi:MAG: class II aldolase/adducin family protein [Verrucomicrobiota bacterium]|nr:class II aldolase/adducin family protein [Verrucomicrobiota bacterium]
MATPRCVFDGFDRLNACRRELRSLGLIGGDANGIAFGNVSIRDGLTNQFYITGSGTGAKEELTPDDYAKVVGYDFALNSLKCEGIAVASAESLTHAAVYECASDAGAVIHVHSRRLWTEFTGRAATTSAAIEYGTPAMAFEVKRLFETTAVRAEKIFVMAGHPDGVVGFGRDLAEAFAVLSGNLRP